VPPSRSSTLDLLKVPSFRPVVLALLFSGLAEATAGSFMALLAVEKIHMAPLELSAFLTLSAVSGLAVTTFFGHMHDRKPVMWPLLLALVARIAGYVLCAFVTDAWVLIAGAFVLFGLSSASFPLLFAIAKGYLDQTDPPTMQRGMAGMRLIGSLSWAIGPAVGAVLVAIYAFEGVFLGAAVMVAVALVIVVGSGLKAVLATEPKPKVTLDAVRAAAPAVIALTAFHTAMFMGGTAMSVVTVQELGTATDVGLLFSLCAALEVVIMSLFVVRPVAGASRRLMLVGFALFAVYFLYSLAFPTLVAFYFGQILRAGGIGIVGVLGMAYLQGTLPGRPGVASALYGNTLTIASLLNGIGIGVVAEWLGYWSIFWVGLVLTAIGALALLFGRQAVTAPSAHPDPSS
jgi:SET family sugar efflux transporter-like MFS transporter